MCLAIVKLSRKFTDQGADLFVFDELLRVVFFVSP